MNHPATSKTWWRTGSNRFLADPFSAGWYDAVQATNLIELTTLRELADALRDRLPISVEELQPEVFDARVGELIASDDLGSDPAVDAVLATASLGVPDMLFETNEDQAEEEDGDEKRAGSASDDSDLEQVEEEPVSSSAEDFVSNHLNDRFVKLWEVSETSKLEDNAIDMT